MDIQVHIKSVCNSVSGQSLVYTQENDLAICAVWALQLELFHWVLLSQNFSIFLQSTSTNQKREMLLEDIHSKTLQTLASGKVVMKVHKSRWKSTCLHAMYITLRMNKATNERDIQQDRWKHYVCLCMVIYTLSPHLHCGDFWTDRIPLRCGFEAWSRCHCVKGRHGMEYNIHELSVHGDKVNTKHKYATYRVIQTKCHSQVYTYFGPLCISITNQSIWNCYITNFVYNILNFMTEISNFSLIESTQF